MTVAFILNGADVAVVADNASLLDVLRDEFGLRSVKDGCSPQGQCGCCTVLVDGLARVSCVTSVRRIAGRSITTVEGLTDCERAAWGEAFSGTGASQCGFCTPGIILRLQALHTRAATADSTTDDQLDVDRALAAHLCRCTGWRTIGEAYVAFGSPASPGRRDDEGRRDRDLEAAGRRARIEGGGHQQVGAAVALGEGGFADDTAPPGALVAVADGTGGWVVAESLAEARAAAGRIQGRRTTVEVRPPLEVPDGDWDLTLRTSWVEPAYLETDASWCEPGGDPATPLANGGAFGGKAASVVTATARRLADEHGRAVRVLLSREDTVRLGPKRPPMAIGVGRDGTGVLRARRTPGLAAVAEAWAPGLILEEVDVHGPPTSMAVRAAGWAELAVVRAALASRRSGAPSTAPATVVDPRGARAGASIAADGTVRVTVACGDPLDEVVLRSYCIGAAHAALGWVGTEGLAVDDAGEVQNLTIRSFGILRATDMPAVEVAIVPSTDVPVNGSDAVFAAVAAATWIHQGCPPQWPTRLPTIDRPEEH